MPFYNNFKLLHIVLPVSGPVVKISVVILINSSVLNEETIYHTPGITVWQNLHLLPVRL